MRVPDRVVRTATLVALAVLYAWVLTPAMPGTASHRADPMSPQVRAVELAIRDHRFTEALQLTQAAARSYPNDPFVKYLEAVIHQRLERWSDEAAAWEAYTAMSDTPAAACPAVAVAYERQGAADRAQHWYRRCAGFEPGAADRHIDLARTRNRTGDAVRP